MPYLRIETDHKTANTHVNTGTLKDAATALIDKAIDDLNTAKWRADSTRGDLKGAIQEALDLLVLAETLRKF